jgi:hypothetical protein
LAGSFEDTLTHPHSVSIQQSWFVTATLIGIRAKGLHTRLAIDPMQTIPVQIPPRFHHLISVLVDLVCFNIDRFQLSRKDGNEMAMVLVRNLCLFR